MAGTEVPLLDVVQGNGKQLTVCSPGWKCPAVAAIAGLLVMLGLPPALWSDGAGTRQTSLSLMAKFPAEKVKVELYGMAG